MIDHDQWFKQLNSTFFVEFLELFFPEVVAYMDTSSIEFLDKELFTDIIEGEKFQTLADLEIWLKNTRETSQSADTTPGK